MSITVEKKTEIINKYGANGQDTGSARVQVAMLTERISALTAHLSLNKKDQSTRLGLLKLVGQRRRFLNYIMKRDVEEYRSLIQQLGIRK